ncbi:unnamed protein product [Caenorhabditis sp. 36 PRJEB53466]|nr:unnamed protein product [Caenorhabditis sp. 36 PRJEB53466]
MPRKQKKKVPAKTLYQCPLCPKKFHRGCGLASHLRRHAPVVIKCPQCNYSCKHKHAFDRHVNTTHGAARSRPRRGVAADSNDEEPEDESKEDEEEEEGEDLEELEKEDEQEEEPEEGDDVEDEEEDEDDDEEMPVLVREATPISDPSPPPTPTFAPTSAITSTTITPTTRRTAASTAIATTKPTTKTTPTLMPTTAPTTRRTAASTTTSRETPTTTMPTTIRTATSTTIVTTAPTPKTTPTMTTTKTAMPTATTVLTTTMATPTTTTKKEEVSTTPESKATPLPYDCLLCQNRFETRQRMAYHIQCHRYTEQNNHKDSKAYAKTSGPPKFGFPTGSRLVVKWRLNVECRPIPQRRALLWRQMEENFGCTIDRTNKFKENYKTRNGELGPKRAKVEPGAPQPIVKFKKMTMKGGILFARKIVYANQHYYYCPKCPYTTWNVSAAWRHFRHHVVRSKQTYRCCSCHYDTIHIRHIQHHVRLHQTDKETAAEFLRWLSYERKVNKWDLSGALGTDKEQTPDKNEPGPSTAPAPPIFPPLSPIRARTSSIKKEEVSSPAPNLGPAFSPVPKLEAHSSASRTANEDLFEYTGASTSSMSNRPQSASRNQGKKRTIRDTLPGEKLNSSATASKPSYDKDAASTSKMTTRRSFMESAKSIPLTAPLAPLPTIAGPHFKPTTSGSGPLTLASVKGEQSSLSGIRRRLTGQSAAKTQFPASHAALSSPSELVQSGPLVMMFPVKYTTPTTRSKSSQRATPKPFATSSPLIATSSPLTRASAAAGSTLVKSDFPGSSSAKPAQSATCLKPLEPGAPVTRTTSEDVKFAQTGPLIVKTPTTEKEEGSSRSNIAEISSSSSPFRTTRSMRSSTKLAESFPEDKKKSKLIVNKAQSTIERLSKAVAATDLMLGRSGTSAQSNAKPGTAPVPSKAGSSSELLSKPMDYSNLKSEHLIKPKLLPGECSEESRPKSGPLILELSTSSKDAETLSQVPASVQFSSKVRSSAQSAPKRESSLQKLATNGCADNDGLKIIQSSSKIGTSKEPALKKTIPPIFKNGPSVQQPGSSIQSNLKKDQPGSSTQSNFDKYQPGSFAQSIFKSNQPGTSAQSNFERDQLDSDYQYIFKRNPPGSDYPSIFKRHQRGISLQPISKKDQPGSSSQSIFKRDQPEMKCGILSGESLKQALTIPPFNGKSAPSTSAQKQPTISSSSSAKPAPLEAPVIQSRPLTHLERPILPKMPSRSKFRWLKTSKYGFKVPRDPEEIEELYEEAMEEYESLLKIYKAHFQTPAYKKLSPECKAQFGRNNPREYLAKELPAEKSGQCPDCPYHEHKDLEKFRLHRDRHYYVASQKCKECNFQSPNPHEVMDHMFIDHYLNDVRAVEGISSSESEPEEVAPPPEKRRRGGGRGRGRRGRRRANW